MNKGRFVYGAGSMDVPGGTWEEGKLTHGYKAWKGMLQRAYCPKFQHKWKTYVGVTVCEDWLHFSKFKIWYDTHYISGFSLDKDLTVLGNREYSPAACCYIPQELNNLFTDSAASRGAFPLGVSFYKRSQTFRAQCRTNGKRKHIGFFLTPEEAEAAYLRVKAEHVMSSLYLAPNKIIRDNMIFLAEDMLIRASTLIDTGESQ